MENLYQKIIYGLLLYFFFFLKYLINICKCRWIYLSDCPRLVSFIFWLDLRTSSLYVIKHQPTNPENLLLLSRVFPPPYQPLNHAAYTRISITGLHFHRRLDTKWRSFEMTITFFGKFFIIVDKIFTLQEYMQQYKKK